MLDMYPVGTASADALYSAHKLEHVFAHEVRTVLNGFFRVLKPVGNLLLSDDPAVKIIKNIILNRIKKYRDHYLESEEGFIKSWPKNANLHGWIIDLKKGGSLGSHMHKLGWLSGSLYLKLKKPLGSNQGNIIFNLGGANYPADSKLYPSKEFNLEKGDIVLFPSSIFHKTVPFESEENRITLAFDIKPVY
jgi:hypothetical protein